MNVPVRILAVLLAAMVSTVDSKNWVLIVSGASGYLNYWSESVSCHVYHTMRNKGVPAENIIQMSYDDIADSIENPIKGNLVTEPNGTNWYPGCEIDYRRKEVAPEVFIKIITGDKVGLRELIGRDGPVIASGPNDDIFVTFLDHGGPGAFYFPEHVPFHAKDLITTLQQMHEDQKYRQMVVYMESCFSGSMFKGLLPNDINIYAATCGRHDEMCYVTSWDSFRKAYLVSQFALSWVYNTDEVDVSKVTLEEQFQVAKKFLKSTSTPSDAQQYGDLTISKEYLGKFQGDITLGQHRYNSGLLVSKDLKMQFEGIDLSNPPLDMVTIATLARRLVESEHLSAAEIRKTRAQLKHALRIKTEAEEMMKDVVRAMLVDSSDDVVNKIMTSHQPVLNTSCYKSSLDLLGARCPGFNLGRYEFTRRNLWALINLCNVFPVSQIEAGITKIADTHSLCWSQ